MSRAGVIRCLVAAVLFGASAPAASVLAQDMSALSLAGLLYLGAAMAVAPVVVDRRPGFDALRREWRPVAVAVVVGGALGGCSTAGHRPTPGDAPLTHDDPNRGRSRQALAPVSRHRPAPSCRGA
jgi:hypothetical protein